MTFGIRHAMGGMEDDPPLSMIEELIAELDSADDEHPDVSISDETGWELSAFRDGRVIWGDVEDGEEEFEMTAVSREEMIRLFLLVARGKREEIEVLPWIRRA